MGFQHPARTLSLAVEFQLHLVRQATRAGIKFRPLLLVACCLRPTGPR
jgi:hypothetical protein